MSPAGGPSQPWSSRPGYWKCQNQLALRHFILLLLTKTSRGLTPALLLLTFVCTGVSAQQIVTSGERTISGYLLSEHDSEPLSFGAVYARNARLGTQADSAGYFALTGLTDGPEILTFTHIGCDGETREITIAGDARMTVYLHHHDNYVETVTVAAKAYTKYGETLDNQATEDLGDALENLTGVSTLRTGAAAAKPVYDGLYGNRLSIQNNGIAQSGQQWGNDHSPEIDPWVAAYVRVIEGVEALRYAGATAGATVLIEPAPLRQTQGRSGKAAYTFQANGLGNVLNARLSNGGKTAYRISLTGKARGDRSAPDYYLRNTGRREADAALQMARFHNSNWTSRLYLSTYNAEIGVLRGSHLGNLTDLRRAIDRSTGGEAPFFTESSLGYDLESPRQAVSHHLVKAETDYRPNDDNRFALRYGGQINDRREFDVRRGGRSDDPALALRQFSHLVEGSWHRELGTGQHLDANVQYDYVTSDNQPGTGVQQPLLPDYNASRYSGYLAFHHERDRFQFHTGLRYDRQFFEAITIQFDVPLGRIERFEHGYDAFGGSAEARWQATDDLSLRAGATYRERAPQINELYSMGLHQGVSGIEEGDANLDVERALKFSLSTLLSNANFGVNATVFAQPIDNYIFLQPLPLDSARVTIRGSFPVFRYASVDALLWGLNVQGYYQITDELKLSGALARVQGRERASGRGLVYIPPTNFRGSLSYQPGGRWEGWDLEAGVYVSSEQNDITEEQDFLEPPGAYSLLNASVAYRWALPGGRALRIRASADNLLNTRFRDYLDRQRYFADGIGRAVDVGVSYAW